MKISNFKNNKGFTLVELLIVIVIIGILSIAIFAAIDPIDQTRRGQDTATRSFSTQVSQAITRYYATYGKFPWDDIDSPNPPSTATTLDNLEDSIDILVDSGELNQNFKKIAEPYQDKITVTLAGTDQVSVCFKPASKAFKKDANNLYSSAGVSETSGCPGGDACHICIK